jgi:DNA-binding beta-propeller fold protein YncE
MRHARLRLVTLSRRLLAASVLPALAGAAWCAPAADDAYRLEKLVATRSSNTGWDYSSLDAERGHMFIARRIDGLSVYDTKKGKLLANIRDAKGANTSALAPEFDLGIAGTTDGHVVLFKLSTLKTVGRYKSTAAGFDGAAYDPLSKRFVIVGEADKQKHSTPVLFFDGKTGQPVGSTEIVSEKVDAPRVDAAGHVFVPLRDMNSVVRLDAQTMKVEATWTPDNCKTPAALDVDAAGQRLFLACRGNLGIAPSLFVLDANTGRFITKVSTGRGTDNVFYDKTRKTIVTLNGEDATLSVIKQKSADEYVLTQASSTRPFFRTGVLDERTGKVYVVGAEYVTRFDEKGAAAMSFMPNTFVVLTYGLAKLPAGEAED